jgi:UDP-N-acetylmuramyl tripeptide synthase
MKLRFWIALWVGKITSLVLKLLGRRGTTMPGFVAGKICPDLIQLLAARFSEGTLVITGTNGKTTTNNLLASILKTADYEIAYNKEGANMLAGITGTLLQSTSWGARPKASLLLLEVDERTLPLLCRQISPRLAVVTNFFRDQLDRYGELDTTVKLVQDSLPESTELILNADDPLVVSLGQGRKKVWYFGVKAFPSSQHQSTESREGRYCSHCGQELKYSLFHYGQLGIYNCSGCDFSRPLPTIEASQVIEDKGVISFQVDQEAYCLPLQGSYNLYNALAAFCAADCLGIDRENIRRGLKNFKADAGRMEQLKLGGSRLTLTLVKNPTGFNQVLSTILASNKPLRLLLAINDLAADGRDVSWLWDVDFEGLAARQEFIRQIICSGLRAEDMALRLKYAGFAENLLQLEHSLEQAVELLAKETRSAAEEEVIFVLPSYTALFTLREILLNRPSEESERQVMTA